MTERYGSAARVVELHPSWEAEETCAFGSWSIEGRKLMVFYALELNGQRPGSCEIVERDDAVVVTVIISAPAVWQTCVGGYRPMSAEIDLLQPLGDRSVIDGSNNEARPSLAALRARRAPR